MILGQISFVSIVYCLMMYANYFLSFNSVSFEFALPPEIFLTHQHADDFRRFRVLLSCFKQEHQHVVESIVI
jgi:hypothetical protein